MNQIFYTKSSLHRGKSRIYLEGMRLHQLGFESGSKYSVSYDDSKQVLTLTLNPNGERKVSGKNKYSAPCPVIDITNGQVDKMFPIGTPIVVNACEEKITISVHELMKNKIQREVDVKRKIAEGENLFEGSLCTGGGISTHAISEGFKSVGLKNSVKMIAELDSRYLQVAVRNFPSVEHIHNGQIENVRIEDIPKLDVLSFSLPCTGHSIAGKSSNKIKIAEEHPTASTSLFGALRYIVHSNPAIIISENVVQSKDSATYILLKSEITRLGYKIQEFILDGYQAGSIENRKRYWFVAISDGLLGDKDLNLSVRDFPKKFEKVGDVVDRNVEHNWFRLDYFDARQEVCSGRGYGFAKNFVNEDSTSVGTIVRNYTKRQISNPHFTNGENLRLFTIKEHSRMKLVPEELTENVPQTVGHEILGQSILYNHALGIAQAIALFLKSLKN